MATRPRARRAWLRPGHQLAWSAEPSGPAGQAWAARVRWCLLPAPPGQCSSARTGPATRRPAHSAGPAPLRSSQGVGASGWLWRTSSQPGCWCLSVPPDPQLSQGPPGPGREGATQGVGEGDPVSPRLAPSASAAPGTTEQPQAPSGLSDGGSGGGDPPLGGRVAARVRASRWDLGPNADPPPQAGAAAPGYAPAIPAGPASPSSAQVLLTLHPSHPGPPSPLPPSPSSPAHRSGSPPPPALPTGLGPSATPGTAQEVVTGTSPSAPAPDPQPGLWQCQCPRSLGAGH